MTAIRTEPEVGLGKQQQLKSRQKKQAHRRQEINAGQEENRETGEAEVKGGHVSEKGKRLAASSAADRQHRKEREGWITGSSGGQVSVVSPLPPTPPTKSWGPNPQLTHNDRIGPYLQIGSLKLKSGHQGGP